MKLTEFDFTLPPTLIATHPLCNRDDSRMLLIPDISDSCFKNFIDLLDAGDGLVLNNTKVIPSRIYGTSKGKIYEVTLHKEITPSSWLGFTKGSKKLKIGNIINFSDMLFGQIKEKTDAGILIDFQEPRGIIFGNLERIGKMPLPPYMNRQEEPQDKTRYQTVFANHEGSVAAPTASLHFTNEMLKKIKEKGIHIIYVTLHVGAGTFLPVKEEDVSKHKMHSEYGHISKDSANLINKIKKSGGKIIAAGTTALRVLESAAIEKNTVAPFNKETDIFILPGYEFKIVDKLLTNFHTPKSTLFMLVCAFAGIETMKKAYVHAIKEKYRFYSYGDCCFIKRK
ncbi:MAG: tRNA preQ1(34) S-adenosylmethionine ribosyltransferase-isomerase QueA [Rickettsiales bacterium]|nr:tRNA preQ1(34) S-adenosylmethionine ribosyltransferase-isomerase QueA [Rickettsiales bacterium]